MRKVTFRGQSLAALTVCLGLGACATEPPNADGLVTVTEGSYVPATVTPVPLNIGTAPSDSSVASTLQGLLAEVNSGTVSGVAGPPNLLALPPARPPAPAHLRGALNLNAFARSLRLAEVYPTASRQSEATIGVSVTVLGPNDTSIDKAYVPVNPGHTTRRAYPTTTKPPLSQQLLDITGQG